jgi:hypothetical protein
MKKIIGMAAVSLFFMGARTTGAQMVVQEVFSLSSLMQAVDTLYATYDHINATIETVKNTYAQLEKAANALRNINFDDVSKLSEIKDIRSFNDFSNYRNNIKNAVSNINANMSYLNDLTDVMTKRSVSVGPYRFTMASMVGLGREGEMSFIGVPKAVWEYVREQGDAAIKGWSGRLTERERTSVMSKWGMSPENYGKVLMAEKITDEIVGKLFGYGADPVIERMLERVARNNQAILEELELAAASESTIGMAKAQGEAVTKLSEEITLLHATARQAADFHVRAYVAGKVSEDALAEEKAREVERRRRDARRMNAANSPYLNHPNDKESLDWLR